MGVGRRYFDGWLGGSKGAASDSQRGKGGLGGVRGDQAYLGLQRHCGGALGLGRWPQG